MKSRARYAAWFALALGACTDRPLEEPGEFIPARVESCKVLCTSLYDPECGQKPRSNDLPHSSANECTTWCATATTGEDNGFNGFNWGRNEDGFDVCAAEFAARSACLASLTCEEQSVYWNTAPVYDIPCKEEAYTVAYCQLHVSENAEDDQ